MKFLFTLIFFISCSAIMAEETPLIYPRDNAVLLSAVVNQDNSITIEWAENPLANNYTVAKRFNREGRFELLTETPLDKTTLAFTDTDIIPDGVIQDSIMVPDPEYPGKRKIVLGATVQPMYITVTTPNDFEGPLALNYKTYNEDGIELSSGELTTVVSGIIDDGESPSVLMVGCYPNPANTEVTFSIEALSTYDDLSITITDIQGNQIGEVDKSGIIAKGKNLIPYNITGLTSGSYYYTLKAGPYTKTKLLNIVK